MNLGAWRKELEASGMLRDHYHILEGFTHGFDQGIPLDPIPGHDFFCPPNHSSALDVREEIEANIAAEIKEGRVFGPFTKEEAFKHLGFFRTNPLGAVVNGDGSLRPISDLSFPRNHPTIKSVNAEVDKTEFETSWDNFESVAEFITNSPGPLALGIYDWAKAYRQIPTPIAQWPFLMIQDFDGKVYVDTRITFGGVAGCGSFGAPADTWKYLMLSKFGFAAGFRWVDDTLFIKEVGGTNNFSMADVVQASQELGVKTNEKKWREFSDEQKYLGFLWNGVKKTVCLPDAKRLERLRQLGDFLSQPRHSYKDVERLVGRLNHAVNIFPQLRCYLVAAYRWMAEWRHRAALREIPDEVKTDLEVWKKTLETADPRRLIPRPRLIDVGWVGNAATSYGIGVVIGRRWARFRLREGWDEFHPDGSRRWIAWAETVAVRLGFIMLQSLKDVRGRQFVMLTDNTTTEGAVRNGKSRDRWVNRQWMLIQADLIQFHCMVKQVRVRSADNDADKLSRGLSIGRSERDEVCVVIPGDLRDLLVQE